MQEKRYKTHKSLCNYRSYNRKTCNDISINEYVYLSINKSSLPWFTIPGTPGRIKESRRF